MDISDFTELLVAARQQQEPQRLLLVFAAARPPSEDEAERHAHPGRPACDAVDPVLCTDKLPDEIGTFERLQAESKQTGVGWDILFVASLPGRFGYPPSSDEAEQPLRMMVEQIRNGQIARFVTVDSSGRCVHLRRVP